MSKSLHPVPTAFPKLLREIKARIQQAQARAVLSVNAELVRLYWDIGRLIDTRQDREGWGAGVIPRLARELHNELPEEKGFSERNIGRMIAFFRAYPDPARVLPQAAAKLPETAKVPQPAAQLTTRAILPQAAAKLPETAKVPQPAAQLTTRAILPQAAAKLPETAKVSQPAAQLTTRAILPQAAAKLPETTKVPQPAAQLEPSPASILWSIPWFHHIMLLEKVKDADTRLWYMAEILANGWSRNVLLTMIQSAAHRRKGKSINNFDRLLPVAQSDLVRQALKDPYVFDFLTLQEPFHERELETHLLHQLERFLLELGQGFAFVGRQFRVEVGRRDFYIDLLFYHLALHCYVVIDLKKGEFKPEYAGKMNFYLGVVDDQLRHGADAPSIGLILCQERNHIVAEYALRDTRKPIGISEYELTRALPANLQSALPTVEQIEAELGEPYVKAPKPAKRSPGKKKTKRGRKK